MEKIPAWLQRWIQGDFLERQARYKDLLLQLKLLQSAEEMIKEHLKNPESSKGWPLMRVNLEEARRVIAAIQWDLAGFGPEVRQ